MSATERLRALLDERDEYYQTSGNKTWWGRPIDRQTGKPINVFHYYAQPMGEDRLFVELQLATPEQAVEATLGRGTCHAIVSDNLTESEGTGDAWADCSECGHLLFVLTDPSSKPPHYCPSCGARVVSDDD